MAKGQIWQGRVLGKAKARQVCAYEAIVFPVQDKMGKLTHYVYQTRKLKNRSQLIKEEEQNTLSLFQATFEATADGILVTNTRGHTLNFNQKFIDLWQFPMLIV
ncbi:MAG: hypothetical protein HC772_07425 [Leptolyngbyaceae cyanobacterium CRU_2_3]|nr:hypothetical protein [Leptolyngbyaceae cyanobacterium CRU_2_3]